jgi:preprotein translocase subunit YajC
MDFLYALGQRPAGAGETPRGSPFGGLLPLILIFFVFYFLLIRPQQRKVREHQKLLGALKKGDEVISSGGIHGTISMIKGDVVDLKIAEGVKVVLSKSAIATVIQSPATSTQEKETNE